MSEWKTRIHQFLPDGIPDLLGAEACLCGLPKSNRLHKVKPTDDAVKDAEARRIGERENQ